MEEIKLKLRHNLPFNDISREFPSAKIFRWCNSYVDYLEFAERGLDKDGIKKEVEKFAEGIGSKIVFSSEKKDYLTIMIVCKCSYSNSTLRMAESMDCIVEAPVVYENNYEYLKIISVRYSYFRKLYNKLSSFSEIEILNKSVINFQDLRNTWTISLSEIFNNLSQKQINIASDAVSKGYFDIPKKISIEELAEANSISKSTMQEHLSKAESKIFRSIESYLRLYETYLEAQEQASDNIQ